MSDNKDNKNNGWKGRERVSPPDTLNFELGDNGRLGTPGPNNEQLAYKSILNFFEKYSGGDKPEQLGLPAATPSMWETLNSMWNDRPNASVSLSDLSSTHSSEEAFSKIKHENALSDIFGRRPDLQKPLSDYEEDLRNYYKIKEVDAEPKGTPVVQIWEPPKNDAMG